MDGAPQDQSPEDPSQQPEGTPYQGSHFPPFASPPSPPGGIPQPSIYPSAPSYPAAGYPQYPPQYSAQYPPQHAPAGFRPGTATAAAVLAFVQAGITLLTTCFGMIGVASGETQDEFASGVAWLVLLAQLVGVALLIAGGVQLVHGTGRTILIIGTALELAICLVYLIAFATLPGVDEDTLGMKVVMIGSATFLAIMPVISLALACTGSVVQWLRRQPGGWPGQPSNTPSWP
ncbi:MAG TPA: hypothetical protein VFV67_27995 [Actinophytocola sp.]|uniref:hypothetical protein n=1 Tax=Actinophytocola sp. TaxID=1872138 RepID=UPI002DBD7985|nr:hypothetical protein [Actinophytocola sp.]HEU5474505.1 hypothetical protein [Actinophytocola sp.]